MFLAASLLAAASPSGATSLVPFYDNRSVSLSNERGYFIDQVNDFSDFDSTRSLPNFQASQTSTISGDAIHAEGSVELTAIADQYQGGGSGGQIAFALEEAAFVSLEGDLRYTTTPTSNTFVVHSSVGLLDYEIGTHFFDASAPSTFPVAPSQDARHFAFGAVLPAGTYKLVFDAGIGGPAAPADVAYSLDLLVPEPPPFPLLALLVLGAVVAELRVAHVQRVGDSLRELRHVLARGARVEA